MISEREQAALDRNPIVAEPISSYEHRPEYWRNISRDDWNSIHWQWNHRIQTSDELHKITGIYPGEREAIEAMSKIFPLAVTPHYLALMHPDLKDKCPLRRQAIPSLLELQHHPSLMDDPLGERRHALTPCLTQRYPDRVLIYSTHACAMRCRHCTRRSRVGLMEHISPKMIDDAIDTVIDNPHIRDVLISGGDALCLNNDLIDHILQRLRGCRHIDVIRLCTRMICTMPQRISDPELLAILRHHAPIYVNTQFNHPFETSTESATAIRLLREAGCILGNQSVLLRDINDDADTLEPLFRWLLHEGCRPYYLFLCDVAQGTHHFRTPIRTGLDIMQHLRGRLSGLAIPHFVVDLPDGMGKVDLCPDCIRSGELGGHLVIRNWFGENVNYEDL